MNTKRVTVNFTPDTYKAIEELAKKRSKTKGEVLRDAIALEKYLTDECEKGCKFLLQGKDGMFHEMSLKG